MSRDRRFVMSGRRPTRYFRTWMGFTSRGDGQWVAKFRGEEFTIEKRRAELGCPAGWYYFGPGARDGVYCGGYPENAAEHAIAEADKVQFP